MRNLIAAIILKPLKGIFRCQPLTATFSRASVWSGLLNASVSIAKLFFMLLIIF